MLYRFHPLMVALLLASLAACTAPTQPAPTAASPIVRTTVLVPQTVVVTAAPLATRAVQQPAPTAGTTKGKPNIIFILADDLDAAAMQYMPKLKSLVADQGVTFPNYFVPESLCCPSRATTLRGQYPHNTKVLSNVPPLGGFQRFYQLDEEQSTIATWLQDVGYRTMLAGKYLNGYPLKNAPLYIPPGWTEWYSHVKGDAYGEYNYTLNENGKEVAYGDKPKDYGTDVYVGKAVDFIQRNAKENKPFFVYLAPFAPHAPYTPAPRHANLFPGLKAPRTPNYNEADVSDKPGYIRNRPLLTQKQIDQIDEAYRKRVQSLQAIDEGIEAIVNSLKANGQLNNTYIFFTSDNGYHLGNHRQVLGKLAPYEEELRVSMMVRGPGVPASKTLDHLTGNVDLAPTWADLAGAKAADFCDGRSLVPLLRANPPALHQWRQAFSLEWGRDPVDEVSRGKTSALETDPGVLEPEDQDEMDTSALPPDKQKSVAVPYFRGVRLQTMSYVEYDTDEIELYDLQADPNQLLNRASKAAPQLLQQLAARVRALATCKAATCRTAEDGPFDPPESYTQTSTLSPKQYGVFVKQDASAYLDTANAVQQLGAGWVRTNANLGEANPDYISYLDAGINVVLTVRNQDPSNIVTTYGTPQEWGAASFPYKSVSKYQQQVQALLQPALRYLRSGQQVWVQGGNEIFDASVAVKSLYWRGTMEQYLAQQQALYAAVKSVSPDIPVVLAGIASMTLDDLIQQNNPGHSFAVNYVTALLTQGKFDAVDLHFYGCVEDIPAKVKSVKKLLPAEKAVPWISTENGGPEVACKSTPVAWSQDLTQFEKLQAQQVPARLSACAGQGGSICLWFSLFDIKSSSDIFNHLGLLDQDKTPPRKKPAYDAFKAYISLQK